ncbi:unnamed protein product [Rotaria sp. Silwood2]|nr:unnamed protein product [Rotaria sp. Silwood2]CAF3156188.1 unnamed protein product [Rotaria sp. Silwood2]CAF3964996.1 unnamed protein product [Rotaria sp. Silwood2]CAF4446050.1 unnamed protein product [Rotaria sp. Silwood2]
MTTESMLDTTKMIFEVNYKLDSFDLVKEDDFEVGPILDNSTLNALTNMMQTTVSNGSNITVIVFNATIEIDYEISTKKIVISDSINYILRLIVYYIFSVTCNICIEISNSAVYNEPQLGKLIEIRNASLIDISRPVTVINIISMPTIQFSTANLNYNSTIKTTSSTVVHTTTDPTISQHQTTEHTSTVHHTSENRTNVLYRNTLPYTIK